jgi:hypothetical protein
MRYLEQPNSREGLVQRVLGVLRGAWGQSSGARPPSRPRDISAEAIEEDEAYLARNPGVRHERRVLACMRSLGSGSPADLLEATYGGDVVREAVDRARAEQLAVNQRRSLGNG